MPTMTCETIYQLASKFIPILTFDTQETLFPALAEAWLTQESAGSWGPGQYDRGTTIMLAPYTDSTFGGDVAGGWHGPGSSPIVLLATGDPNAIGNPTYATYDPATSGKDLFLDFAGWADVPTDAAGQLAYIQATFSGLGNAMNPDFVTPPAPADLPSFVFPQPDQPTVYAEVEWAGEYPRFDAARVKDHPGDQYDFPPTGPDGVSPYDQLDGYIVVTYYYLFPATSNPPIAGSSALQRESQWEAISLFFSSPPNQSDVSPTKRPDFPQFDVENALPKFVVYSGGYQDNNGVPLNSDYIPLDNSECQPWSATSGAIQFLGFHPIAFVTCGTHRLLFQPTTAIPATGIGTGGTADELAIISGTLFGIAGLVVNYCPLLAAAGHPEAAAACYIICAYMGLLALIFFFLWWLVEQSSSSSGGGGSGATPPAPADSAPDTVVGWGPAAAPPGAPVLGHSSVVDFVLRVIDRFQFDSVSAAYPPPASSCEHPTWWDFAGRWGIRTTMPSLSGWDNGPRRVDKYGGRSRGYWNAYALVKFWAQNPQYGP